MDSDLPEVAASTPMAAVADAPREVELKLHVPAASAPLIWTHPLVIAATTGAPRVARVDNRYFDTDDRALAQAGVALRLRRIGRQWVQTLKASAPGDGAVSARREWEMPVAGPALELGRLRDTPLAALGSTRVLARRLAPVFTTNFRREMRLLRLPDGTVVECALDVGTIVAGRGRARRTLPIHELEIEVKARGEGDEVDAILRLAERLGASVPLVPLADSKAARGHRLADGRTLAPAKVVLPVVRADARATHHLAAVLSACQAALLENVHGILELSARRVSDGPAPDSSLDEVVEFIHQARVAIRRARSAMFTFRRATKGARADRLDEVLRTIGHALGDARDLDVFAGSSITRFVEKIDLETDGNATLTALRDAIAVRRGEAHRALLATLESASFGVAMIGMTRWTRRLARDADSPTVLARAPAWLAKQRERVIERSRRIADLGTEGRHALRIEVKRLRYALDLFDGLFAAGDGAFHDALAELQTKLGRINDDTVAARLALSLAPGPGRDLLFARYDAWLDRNLRKQLPKVAALSVEFELVAPPWSPHEARDLLRGLSPS
jgi:triphosphatase